MREYHDLVEHVLKHGVRKGSRTGVDTLSTFAYSYTIETSPFPLLTTKKVSFQNVAVELIWFLTGRTDVEWLNMHGCKIWDEWQDENGELGPIYGHQWRSFRGDNAYGYVDQVANLVDDLKTSPLSRRHVLTAWNPVDIPKMQLAPCHAFCVFNVQPSDGGNILNLHLTQRSADIALGVPYNIASYALLLNLMAKWAGLQPGKLSHTLVDAHIYTSKADGSMAEYDHVPGLKEQLKRKPRVLPTLKISDQLSSLWDLEELAEHATTTKELMAPFTLSGYDPHGPIKFKVAV